MLSGELATTLSGRYIEFNIHSLSYLEFLNFHQLEKGTESILKFLTYGGMPFLVLYLADNVGSLFSANNISKFLKSQRIALLTKME